MDGRFKGFLRHFLVLLLLVVVILYVLPVSLRYLFDLLPLPTRAKAVLGTVGILTLLMVVIARLFSITMKMAGKNSTKRVRAPQPSKPDDDSTSLLDRIAEACRLGGGEARDRLQLAQALVQ